MALMFGVSGLRGIAGKDLTEEVAFGYIHAFGRFLKAKKVVVGYDTRPSSGDLFGAVVRAFNYIGCNAISLGVVPTPTVLFIVKRLKAQGGVVITASHNPIEYNGLKFISKRGEFLNKREFKLFRAFLDRDNTPRPAKRTGLLFLRHNLKRFHINSIVKTIKPKPMCYKVGVDAGNGAGSEALPTLLERLGCRVYKLNCKLRADFSRNPEPIPENIGALCRLVKEKKLDLGFACDPDCDRLSIVDEKGNAIGEEYTLVLATDYILSKKRGDVATNLSTTAMMDYITDKYGCRLYRAKVGEANVVEKMKKVNAVIGGEGNGGVIYPEINFTRDALTGAAIIVKLLTERNKKISQIIGSYPEYYMLKKKIRISRKRFEKRKNKIIKEFRGRVNLQDGLRITGRDYWLHIRPSNTEPIVRIIGEGKNKRQIKEYVVTANRMLG